MVPFVQQVADALTPEAPADEAGCDPCVTGARDPSLRQARCLGGRDERIDARAMSYNWRMKALEPWIRWLNIPRRLTVSIRKRAAYGRLSGSMGTETA